MWEVIKQFKILLTFSVIVIGLGVFALYQYFMVALYII
jgi:hypothetical protein